jgi:hypothetical protein
MEETNPRKTQVTWPVSDEARTLALPTSSKESGTAWSCSVFHIPNLQDMHPQGECQSLDLPPQVTCGSCLYSPDGKCIQRKTPACQTLLPHSSLALKSSEVFPATLLKNHKAGSLPLSLDIMEMTRVFNPQQEALARLQD